MIGRRLRVDATWRRHVAAFARSGAWSQGSSAILPTVAQPSSSVRTFGPSASSYAVGRPGVSTPVAMSPNKLAHEFAEDLRCGLGEDADVQADDGDLVSVDQDPVGDRGLACGKAVDDDSAG